MDYANVALALFAGLLSILSPCVLPLVPVVLGTAVSEHRLGPLALATGLATSFTAIGLFVATVGYSVGLDGELFRVTGAVLLVAAGFALMLPRLQIQFALAVRAARQLDQTEIWKHGNGRIARPIRCWIIARCRLESVRGAHLGRRLRSRGSGPEPGFGRTYHAVLWSRQCRSPDGVRTDIPRSDDARTASPSLGRHKWQGSSGRHPDRQRLAHPVRSGSCAASLACSSGPIIPARFEWTVLERATRRATRRLQRLVQPRAAEGLQIMVAVRLPLPWQLVCDPGE